MWLFILACASEETPKTPAKGLTVTDTDDSGEPDDTGPTEPPVRCPTGMVGVPPEDPAYCIDAFEASVVDGVAVSAAGVLPEVGVTFEEAMALCEASPAVNAEGEVIGSRRLATSAEWEDAGDGVIGDGGTVWPWGDTAEDRCATVGADNQPRYGDLQLTGTFPDCVTPSGIYDQIGNAWEWLDSGRIIDVSAAREGLAEAGVELATDEAGLLVLIAGDPSVLRLEAAGLGDRTVTVSDDGYLEIDPADIETDVSAFFGKGWLQSDTNPDGLLPVALEGDPADLTLPWSVRQADEYDGAPLPDKRGCAWYSGDPAVCTLAQASYAHLPDFDGTIGFRCVTEPW